MSWRRNVWDFTTVHLAFWAPLHLPEFIPGTRASDKLAAEFAKVDGVLATLDDAGLAQIITEFKDDLDANRSSISEMRSRAAQLLAAAGFVAVLATLGTALPPKPGGQIVTYVLVFLALYALIGTMWLTTQALAVRSWNSLDLVPIPHLSARRIKETYASELHRVRRCNGVRLQVPVGYLRDAYWYFFATVGSFVLLVIVRYLPFAHA